MTASNEETHESYTSIMLRAADQMGCNLEATPDRPNLLRGFCPFHNSTQIHNSLTPMVDTKTGFFTCYNCKTRGNTKTFVAKAWEDSLSDVTILAKQIKEPGMDRPPYPES